MANPECGAHGEPGHNAAGPPATLDARVCNARSWFSGSPIEFGLACTARDGQACQIVRHLPVWNEFLYFLHYELRESSGASGQLSLVDIDYPRLSRPREEDYATWQQVNFLINRLLGTHRCIGTLDLKCSFSSRILHPSEYFFCDALRMNPSIKTLKMNFLDEHKHENVCAAISSCVKLERLELELSLRPPEGLLPALTTLLSTTTALTVLKMPQLHITEQQADSFLTALRENATLKELSMCESPYAPVSVLNRPEFADYLKNTTTLTTLSAEVAVATDYEHENRWLRSLEGISENRTITKVCLRNVVVDEASSGIVAKIFAPNSVLRSVVMILRSEPVAFRSTSITNCDGLEAFEQNETLEEVTLSCHIWPVRQWGRFFAAAAGKQNLRKVTVSVSRENRHLLPQLRSFLRESGAAQKKTVLDPGCYFLGSKPGLPECGAFSRVCGFRDQYTKLQLFQVLERATSLDHIAHLFLQIVVADFDKSLASAIAKYVKATSALQELHLSTTWSPLTNNAPYRSWNTIVSSLFENKSIKQLSVSATYMNDEDVERLADAVKLSSVIRGADFINETPEKSRVFFHRLSANIAENYNILRVNFFTPTERDSPAFRDWYAVWEVARRNSDLIRRAAAFVSGARSDRCCASALERVARHPALPEKIAQLCSVNEAEAARMVRTAFARLQRMEAFMRLTGVVRERVVCHRSGDGRLQLQDLNDYCWAALRRYLTLGDVKECPACS